MVRARDIQVVAGPPGPTGDGTVTWSTVGAPAATSAQVKARLDSAETASLKVATDTALTVNVAAFGPATPDAVGFVTLNATGLSPDTDYHYGVEVDNQASDAAKRGQFHTLPTPGTQYGFSFAHGHCHLSTSVANTPALAHINDVAAPLFYAHIGDFDYGDHDGSSVTAIRGTYDTQWAGANLQALARSRWYVNTWDDHDFGGNNSDGTLANKTVRSAEWQRYFPHPELVDQTTDGAIYYSFVVGRVRFVVLDGRYYSSPNAATDNASKTVLGAAQKSWLVDLLAQPDPLFVLFHSRPWHAPQTAGEDDWGGYTTERREIADAIEAAAANVVHISGDMHGLACADDSAGTDYTTSGGGAPQLVLIGGAIDQTGSVKGGPYRIARLGATAQQSLTDNNYGRCVITDDGETVALSWEGRKSTSGTTHTVPVPTDGQPVTASFVDQYWVGGAAADWEQFGFESDHVYYDTVAVDVGEEAAFTGAGTAPYVEF